MYMSSNKGGVFSYVELFTMQTARPSLQPAQRVGGAWGLKPPRDHLASSGGRGHTSRPASRPPTIPLITSLSSDVKHHNLPSFCDQLKISRFCKDYSVGQITLHAAFIIQWLR